jgi:hypothetical protein
MARSRGVRWISWGPGADAHTTLRLWGLGLCVGSVFGCRRQSVPTWLTSHASHAMPSCPPMSHAPAAAPPLRAARVSDSIHNIRSPCSLSTLPPHQQHGREDHHRAPGVRRRRRAHPDRPRELPIGEVNSRPRRPRRSTARTTIRGTSTPTTPSTRTTPTTSRTAQGTSTTRTISTRTRASRERASRVTTSRLRSSRGSAGRVKSARGRDMHQCEYSGQGPRPS